MTIPLDNLYHYIEGLFPEPVCMYLFYPHGTRNILNLIGNRTFDRYPFNLDGTVLPQVICVDQEPLNFEFYQQFTQHELNYFSTVLKKEIDQYSNLNIAIPENIYDSTILIHSEKNSEDLKKYHQNNYIDIYYWCHAIIARDWYRFAQHDHRLQSSTAPQKDFLIYCRDWSGTREYRIKFQELLYNSNLVNHSITGIMKTNGCGYNINNFNFKNQNFIPNSSDFLMELSDNTADSSCSADYDPKDFINSRLSVVLETIFDGDKIHLTEKILRPIACGHPFVLAAAPGSLDYLRSYGFKTFDPWINEDYDRELNSVNRLKKIINSMSDFANLSANDKTQVYAEIKKIADYNKQWFFSSNFVEVVLSELKNNIQTAMTKVKQTRSTNFRSRKIKKTPQNDPKKRKIIADSIKKLRKFNNL